MIRSRPLRRLVASLALVLSCPGLAGAVPIAIRIDPSRVRGPVSRHLTGVCIENVNHEIYGGLYSQMIFGESFQERPRDPAHGESDQASGQWTRFTRGDAVASTSLIQDHPFVGQQSQRLSFERGSGEAGLANSGLNRQGLYLVSGKPYVGRVWARSEQPTNATVSLASADGSVVYASADVAVSGHDWHRYDFTLTPNAADGTGRFQVSLKSPGSVDLGYVFLSPGDWGTFHGLPVRKDVAEAMVAGGVTAVRYGGSMVNEPTYRWKQMVGDRDHRLPYRGHWYPHSTNGWGIIDFLNFAEAAGFLAVPTFNIDESPQDMLDFIDYVNGPATSEWGAKRAAEGHPQPYHLTHLELGNEERVDRTYWRKFEAIARAIWSKDPSIVLTVGDFEYREPITDAMHVRGATSGITSLEAQRKILALAKSFDAEVWFDIHVWTGEPQPIGRRRSWQTYIDAIDGLAQGAKHHVVIFELNADQHDQQRALANAQALMDVERDGRLPFLSSANGLQVDHQNDNGWDQGLLFMNPGQTWLQPPGHVWQMASAAYLPRAIDCELDRATGSVEAVATASEDGKTIALQLLNLGDEAAPVAVAIAGWEQASARDARTLSASRKTANTAEVPNAVQPTPLEVKGSTVTLPPHSFSIVRWTH